MAIIDTLRLARALHERGGFSQEAADATAEALNAALGEDVATKADIGRLEAAVDRLAGATKSGIDQSNLARKASFDLLDGKIQALDSKLLVLMWAVGINAAATITMLVKLWPAQ